MKSFWKKAAFVCLSLIIISSCATTGANKNKTEKSAPAKSASYKTVQINEELNYLSTKISFPEFADYPELSKRIRNSVESEWKSFKSYSQGQWNEINALNSKDGSSKYPPFEYMVTFQVSASAHIVSVLLNTYVFNGGAHGNTTLISWNYDTSEEKFLNITQASKMTYNEISEICRESLYKSLIDDNPQIKTASEVVDMKEMINMGAFPQAGNFEIFTIKGKKLTVYFEPYSVAPYVYGIQTVEIPLK